MSTETEILAEVESLKARFPETKALYREVCALLFFRHGITPTSSKLYQFVRKGSMAVPSEVLGRFWDELRSKARVEIDHPDLPDEVKEAAASAIAAIWRQATAAAREELNAMRLEVSGHLLTAQDERTAAVQAAASQREANERLLEQLSQALAGVDLTKAEAEMDRRAHAATAARQQETLRACEDLRSQVDQQRNDFSADLAKAREAVDTANKRSDAAERRALLEMDQERQARSRADKALEAGRVTAAQTEERLRAEARALIESNTRATATVEALTASNQALQAEAKQATSQVELLRSQMDGVNKQLTQVTAEAQTLRGVVERLSPALAISAAPSEAPPVRTRRRPTAKPL